MSGRPLSTKGQCTETGRGVHQVYPSAAVKDPSSPRVHPAPPYAPDPGRRASQLPPIDDNRTYDAEKAYGAPVRAKTKGGWTSFNDTEARLAGASQVKRCWCCGCGGSGGLTSTMGSTTQWKGYRAWLARQWKKWQHMTELSADWEYRRAHSYYEGLALHALSPTLATANYPWLLSSKTEAIVTILQLLGAGVGALPYFFPLPPEVFLASFLLIPPFLHRVCLFDLPLLRLLFRRFESWYLLWNSLMGIVCALWIYTHPYAILYAVLLWVTSTPIVLADAIALSPYLTLASQLLLGVAAFFFASTIALELSNYADFQIAFFHMQVKAVLASRIFTASVFCFKYSWMLFARPEAFVVLSVPYLRKSASMLVPQMPPQPAPPSSPSAGSAENAENGRTGKRLSFQEPAGQHGGSAANHRFSQGVGEGGLFVGTSGMLAEMLATGGAYGGSPLSARTARYGESMRLSDTTSMSIDSPRRGST